LKGKDWFVVTSNADMHFEANGFESDRIWEVEGTFFGDQPGMTEWTAQRKRFNAFIQRNAERKTVQLELGIGKGNRLIKAQLMQIVSELPSWSYITLNRTGETAALPTIARKTAIVEGDITDSLRQIEQAEPNADFLTKVNEARNAFDYENLVMQTQENYSMNYQTYAHGGTAVPLDPIPQISYDEQIKTFASQIEQADHIIVGGASGLSAAGGGDFYYAATPSFHRYFGRFEEKYGIKGAFAGMQYPWKTRGEFWAYLATFLHTTQHAPLRTPYANLQKILAGRSHFIITTNQDTQAIKAFPEHEVAELQGDHRFFQCSRACTDEIWDAVKPVQKMIDSLGADGTSVPDELIPHCPQCGAEAFPWVRGYGNFLEGSRYHAEYAKASRDIEEHIKKGDRILFLELGVGRMTPMFIQEPFWALTATLPTAFDVIVNRDYQFLPHALHGKGLAIKGDIAQVLDDVLAQMKKDGAVKE
jgi:NAD-dependent SIR2 family protein deacetylase